MRLQNKITTVLIVLFTVILSSCNKSHVEIDQSMSIQEWVDQNYEELAQLTRAEICAYPADYKRTILYSQTSERKKELWQDKVNHVLSFALPEEEIEFLQWFAIQFEQFDYSKPRPAELEEKLFNKAMEGMEKFEWSHDFVNQAFFKLDDIIFTKKLGPIQLDPSELLRCNCYYTYFGCATTNGCNNDEGACNNPFDDCGFWGGTECTGLCE